MDITKGIPFHSQIEMNVPATLPNHVVTLSDLGGASGGGGALGVWNNTTNYGVGGAVQLILGSDYRLYRSLQPSGPGTANGPRDPTERVVTDAAEWETKTLPATGGWYHIAFNPGCGRFIIIDTATPTAAICSDDLGDTWQTMPNFPNGQFSNIVATDNLFVLLSNSAAVMISEDGEEWTTSVLPVSGDFIYGTYDKSTGVFLLTTGSSTVGLRSDDNLATWETVTIPARTSGTTPPVAGDGVFYIQNMPGGGIFRSEDGGYTWDVDVSTVRGGGCIIYGDGKLFIPATDGTAQTGYISLDQAASWAATLLPLPASKIGSFTYFGDFGNHTFLTAYQFNSTDSAITACLTRDGFETWETKSLTISPMEQFFIAARYGSIADDGRFVLVKYNSNQVVVVKGIIGQPVCWSPLVEDVFSDGYTYGRKGRLWVRVS